MYARSRPLTLLLAALSIGCSMPAQPEASSQATSSTQGTTLVRTATVTAVGSAMIVAEDAPGPAGEVITGNPAAPQDGRSGRVVTELELRFEDDDGATVLYRIEPGAVFQPGERVQVIARNGRLRITH